jgi:hypothetical protein
VRLEPVARDARVTGIGRVGGGGGVHGAYCSDRVVIKSAVGAEVILLEVQGPIDVRRWALVFCCLVEKSVDSVRRADAG